MIEFSERDGAVVFSVRVVPRASRSEIAGEQNGALRVRVSAPPVDGSANKELINVLARELEVARRNVEITSGETSRLKRVRVAGTTRDRVESILQGNQVERKHA